MNKTRMKYITCGKAKSDLGKKRQEEKGALRSAGAVRNQGFPAKYSKKPCSKVCPLYFSLVSDKCCCHIPV